MSRLPLPATIADAPLSAQSALEKVNNLTGSVPNLIRILSHSPITLHGYIALNDNLERGTLDVATRERIALAVAQVNNCDYCLAAHSYLAKSKAKLTRAEIHRNRKGGSTDVKADIAVKFAKCVAQNRGQVEDDLFEAVKAVGFSQAQIVEIVALVALNTLTNYINKVLITDLDFPPSRDLAIA